MGAQAHPNSERAIAATILLAALVLAAWVVMKRVPELPLPVPLLSPHEPISAEDQPAAQSPAPSPNTMTFEIVELPPLPAAQPAPPARVPMKAQALPPAPSVPQPARPVQASSAQPTLPEPIAPSPPEDSPQVAVVRAAPAEPVVPQARVPLQADVEPPTPIVPLQPEPERPRSDRQPPVVPLQAEQPRPHVAPLAPEPEIARVRPPAQQPMTPLVPEPEKPAPEVQRPAPQPRPEPVEVKISAAVPMPRPAPKAEAEPKPDVPAPTPALRASAPPRAPAPPKVISGSEAAGEGRVLLRIFEQGSGPAIEIRWPSDPAERDRLYDTLVRCLGMRVGIVDAGGHLYLPEGQPNQPSELNTDRYSGFVRRPEGAIAADEQREIARVRAYHSVAAASPARIFPRAVDAFLIGGLREAVGDDYLKSKSIRAAYRLEGGRVTVDSIVADGRSISGVIDLSAGRNCR